MCEEKLVKKNFDFLKLQGFKSKISQNNFEKTVYYIKKDIVIEICIDVRENIMWIVVQTDNKRTNLFDSNIFNRDKLELLKRKIESIVAIKDLNQQLTIYSEFLKNNFKV